MKLADRAFVPLTLSVVLAAGCVTDPSPGPDAGSDSAAGPQRVSLSMTVREYGTLSPLEGAVVTADETSYTTDGAGTVTVMLPENATSAIGLTHTGFPDYLLYATTLEVDQVATYDLGSDATIAALASALMLTRDPSKGQLSVGVLDGSPGSSDRLAGATIRIDAASEAQLVFDSSASAGFSPGDTTLEGSSSASIFVNVAAGTITPTITPPSGYTCDLGPSTLEVVANGYTVVNYYCHL